jgi:hypothetical protein
MKKFLFILMIILAGCGHKKIKGDRDIETPTSPGKKSGLTTRPESIGVGSRRQRRNFKKHYPDYNQDYYKDKKSKAK